MAAILSRPQYVNSEIVISLPFPVPLWVKWIDQVELKYNRKPIHFSPTFFFRFVIFLIYAELRKRHIHFSL